MAASFRLLGRDAARPSHQKTQRHQAAVLDGNPTELIASIECANKRIKEILQRQKGIQFERLGFKQQQPSTPKVLQEVESSNYELQLKKIQDFKSKFDARKRLGSALAFRINHHEVQSQLATPARQVEVGTPISKLKGEFAARSERRSVLNEVVKQKQNKFMRLQEKKLQMGRESARLQLAGRQQIKLQQKEAGKQIARGFRATEKQQLSRDSQQDVRSRSTFQRQSAVKVEPDQKRPVSGYRKSQNPIYKELSKQIQLDLVLREKKRLFDFDLKGAQLQRLLRRQDCGVRVESLKPSLEEIDPLSTFYDDVSAEALLQSWKKADRNWQQRLARAFRLPDVEQFFRAVCGKNPSFVLEGLVRHLNLELSSNYRNRDLVLVVRRLGVGREPVTLDGLSLLVKK